MRDRDAPATADARPGVNLRRILPYALAAALLVFLFVHHGIELGDVWARVRAGGIASLAAVLCFALQLQLNVVAFGMLLRALNEDVPRALPEAYAASMLGKYVPGGIWQIAGRVALLRAHGVSARSCLLASVIEQGFALLLSLAFAVAAHLAWRGDAGWTPAVALLIVVGALGACVLAARLLEWSTTRSWPVPGTPARWRTRGLLLSALLLCIGLVAFGAGYLLLLSSASAAPGFESWARDASAIFYGTAAGLAVVFVPGGIGIREGVAAEVGQGGATFLAAMLLGRIAIVIAELGYFAVTRMLRRT